MKIALVGNYPEGTYEAFEKKLPQNIEMLKFETQEKFDTLSEADCVVLRTLKMPKEIIENIKNLKFIQRWGTGFDTVDIQAAGQKGIIVANAQGVNAVAVAEMTISLILSIYRNIVNHNIELKKGVWTKEMYTDRTFTLNGKVVGLIGTGSIGRKVSSIAQAFGAEIQYFDLYRMNEMDEAKYQMRYLPFNDLISTSDIISIHVPLTEETKHMINSENIKLMKPNAILINTSRGGIVNERDLVAALNNNKILGAGIDCPEHEPISPDDPLLKLDNVVLTPHVGGTSADLKNNMINVVTQNIINFYNDAPINYIVNKEFIKK